MTATRSPAPPELGPDLDDEPRRPVTMRPEDHAMMLGTALASIALVWVVYYRFLPLEGPFGFWFLSWLGFVVLYRYVVRTTHGRLAATDRVVTVLMASVSIVLFAVLALIIGYVVVKGLPGITSSFFTQTLEDVGPLDPESKGGALHAIVGSLEQMALTVLMSVPVGITTAVFLNEVGGRLVRPVRTLVDAMSGVPSIVAGLFIYTALLLGLGWGFSGFAASLALAVLMLPTVTRTTEEVLRLVPGGLREAALALGAPRWRVVIQVVLPTARSGVATAVILGLARAVGETAPLILTSFGSSAMNANPFSGPQQSLPLYTYQLVRNADPGQVRRAWAGALALLVIVLVLFSLARWAARSAVSSRGYPPVMPGAPRGAFDRVDVDPALGPEMVTPPRRRRRRSAVVDVTDDPAIGSPP